MGPSNGPDGQLQRLASQGLGFLEPPLPHQRRGDPAGAEAQLLQSLSSLEWAYGSQSHPNVHETKRALMTLYRHLRKPELIERYRVPEGRFIPY